MTTETLSQRVARVADEIYERTIRGKSNWIDHWHGPEDRAEDCAVCKTLGLISEDWENALQSE